MPQKSTEFYSTKILNYPLKNPEKQIFTSKQLKDIIKIEQFEKQLDLPKMPSVTKILNETMPEESKARLQLWEENMIKKLGSQEAFDAMVKETKDTGTSMHNTIANYYLTNDLILDIIGDADKELVKTLVQSVKSYLNDFQPLNLESHVVHPGLGYHGYIDAVMYSKKRKQLIILDWKTSKRPKTTLQSTYENPLQLAAYAGALNHDPRYPYQVEGACLVIAYKFQNIFTVR